MFRKKDIIAENPRDRERLSCETEIKGEMGERGRERWRETGTDR